jgi:hypothetical protein
VHHLEELADAQPSQATRQPARLKARVVGGATELGDHDVRVLLDDELRAALADHRDSDLVPHRRGREVHRLFLAEQLGHPALELVDRRVLALLLVPHFSPRHRIAHALRRLRRRVGTEIDHGRNLRVRS